MKPIKLFISICFLAGASACELLLPGDIINPNVDEDTFLKSANAMQSWVNGTNKSFAEATGSFAELTEILSDNYFNNYTQSSKVFDIPRILHTDADVTALQRYIGTLREAANYGINEVAQADPETTDSHLFNLYYIKGYSYLLAGEYFTALPVEAGGEVIEWRTQLTMAIETFRDALEYAGNREDTAFINTLIARAYHKSGDKTNAVSYAKAALEYSTDFVKNVYFDGEKGVTNSIQLYTFGFQFQPLPRLDFLDPKYFVLTNLEQRPICIAKAEELHLILAEASLAGNNINLAKQQLKELLALVANRPVETVDDQRDDRHNGGFKHYPDTSAYKVAASPNDPFREGLVLDRRPPRLISISYISGTSVDTAMIDNAPSVNGLLEIVYLMRQEIFFAEGRRASDLGIRLPICEIEAANTSSAAPYIEAQIPPFIPLGQELDAFEMDDDAKTVVIKHNMNKIIVENKASEYVAPFF
jgi:tetratricopeptide (TPR) repeat protein